MPLAAGGLIRSKRICIACAIPRVSLLEPAGGIRKIDAMRVGLPSSVDRNMRLEDARYQALTVLTRWTIAQYACNGTKKHTWHGMADKSL
jgi:hypothetical protein